MLFLARVHSHLTRKPDPFSGLQTAELKETVEQPLRSQLASQTLHLIISAAGTPIPDSVRLP